PLSLENGILRGSAQTRSTLGSTSSKERSPPSFICARATPPIAQDAAITHTENNQRRCRPASIALPPHFIRMLSKQRKDASYLPNLALACCSAMRPILN